MRKYIISDLHGDGVVYDSIMSFLENVSLIEDVELYINGDLIDRGLDGYRMLNDVINRVRGLGNVKIHVEEQVEEDCKTIKKQILKLELYKKVKLYLQQYLNIVDLVFFMIQMKQ